MKQLTDRVYRLLAILVMCVWVPIWMFFYMLVNEPSTLLIVVSMIVVPVLVGVVIGRMF